MNPSLAQALALAAVMKTHLPPLTNRTWLYSLARFKAYLAAMAIGYLMVHVPRCTSTHQTMFGRAHSIYLLAITSIKSQSTAHGMKATATAPIKVDRTSHSILTIRPR